MEMLAGFIAAVAAFFAGLFQLPGDVLAYTAPLITREPPRATVLFAGDMMFDRSIRVAMQQNGDDHVFSCIAERLQEPGIVVANLEGPITENRSRSVGSTPGDSNNFTFTFPTSTAALLYRHNIRLVNLGNNHIYNFGDDGVKSTKEWLLRAGVAYFGDPESPEHERVARITLNSIPFAFVNWSDWTSTSAGVVADVIAAERAAGRIVVVYTHWGEEYIEPTARVRSVAHRFVDAGAEIVIGSHPHVVQEHEIYNGKHIYYSLGNFVFDQYWMESVRTGLVVEVTFDQSGVMHVEEQRVSLGRDRRTCLLDQ